MEQDNKSDMTMRDYFAAHALAGFTGSRVAVMPEDGSGEIKGKKLSEVLANTCYNIADAMLERRKR